MTQCENEWGRHYFAGLFADDAKNRSHMLHVSEPRRLDIASAMHSAHNLRLPMSDWLSL